MAEKQSLLIIGSTGWIGIYITNAIVASKAKFEKVVIFTSEKTLKDEGKKGELVRGWKSQGVEVIVGDLEKEDDLAGAFKGITTVISCVGRAIIQQQIPLLHLILTRTSPQIRHFYPSEYGTDIEYGPSSATEPPHQNKLKVRTAINELVKQGKMGGKGQLSYTYIVTGPFAGGYLDKAGKGDMGGFDVQGKKAEVLGDEKGRVSLCSEGDVGKLLVASLLHPTESANRALKVNSFTTTPLSIVSEFEKQTGGQKWGVEFVPLEKAREVERKAYEDGEPRATGWTLRRIWAEGGTLYDERDNGIIGAEEGLDTLEDEVKIAIQKQTS